MNTVNFASKATVGMEKKFHNGMGDRKGRVDFTIMPLDDFEMILGKDSLP